MEFEVREIVPIYCIHCTLPLEYCYKTDKCIEFWKVEHPDIEESLSQEYKKPKKVKTEKIKGGGQIVVTITSRSKKKHITSIAGLEAHEIDMKAFAKTLAKQFACSTSANSNEIVVQGDLTYEIEDILKEALGPDLLIEIKKKEKKKESQAK
eukprot:NODE_1_length_95616_cov_0.657642.p65 type:complete len:152 gc:universal NODE_1_length_95616_cov_0.657642:85685-85230(-)